MRPLLIIATGFLATAGCTSTSGDENGSAVSSATTDVTTTIDVLTTEVLTSIEVTTSADGSAFEVAELGLTFRLPTSYTQLEDPELLFLAQSRTPLSVFSIAGDKPTVINSPARPGETLVELDLGGGIAAVVVLNAALGGLPDGVVANEFLVANGSWSFSAIMSAGIEDLAELWDVFVRSVVLTPNAN